MKTDEEMILDVLRSLGGKASRRQILEVIQEKAFYTDHTYRTLFDNFHDLMTGLLAAQDIVIMPDGEYQINNRVPA